jgi:hypothetical protein
LHAGELFKDGTMRQEMRSSTAEVRRLRARCRIEGTAEASRCDPYTVLREWMGNSLLSRQLATRAVAGPGGDWAKMGAGGIREAQPPCSAID